jgi:hypothetical protein
LSEGLVNTVPTRIIFDASRVLNRPIFPRDSRSVDAFLSPVVSHNTSYTDAVYFVHAAAIQQQTKVGALATSASSEPSRAQHATFYERSTKKQRTLAWHGRRLCPGQSEGVTITDILSVRT